MKGSRGFAPISRRPARLLRSPHRAALGGHLGLIVGTKKVLVEPGFDVEVGGEVLVSGDNVAPAIEGLLVLAVVRIPLGIAPPGNDGDVFLDSY